MTDRDAFIAGLRELADWYDQHPQVPAPAGALPFWVWACTPNQFAARAAALRDGGPAEFADHDGIVDWTRRFRPATRADRRWPPRRRPRPRRAGRVVSGSAEAHAGERMLAVRVWTGVFDRDGWGPGPWDDEPDKATWVDSATGLDCMIRRSPMSGAWCGYVGVPPGHDWHGRGYGDCLRRRPCEDFWCDHSPEALVQVHGGLTFVGGCDEDGDVARSICHVPEPGRPDDVWWFGFDCGHAGDLQPGMEALARHAKAELDRLKRKLDDVEIPADQPPAFGGRYRDQSYAALEVLRLADQLAHPPTGQVAS